MNKSLPTFREALAIVSDRVGPVVCEQVPVADALGRWLTHPVASARDYPAFDMSAMDGFAIHRSDIGGTERRSLRIGHPQLAGVASTPLEAGEARPIATGSAIPRDTGAVLVRERAVIAESNLLLSEDLPTGMNIRFRGEDASAGEAVLQAGGRVHPAQIGALLSYGVAQIAVRRRIRVAVLSSGNELRSVDTAEQENVIDSNGPMIAALLDLADCDVMLCPALADDLASVIATLENLLRQSVDMIVTTGGVSVGDRDLIPAAIRAVGGSVHFHGVHMRPGKPVLFATHRNGCTIFGLPGNPVAALVGARFFMMRALRAMLGLENETPEMSNSPVVDGVTRVLKALRSGNSGNANQTEILPGQQSHVMRPLLNADCWLISGGDDKAERYPMYDMLNRAAATT